MFTASCVGHTPKHKWTSNLQICLTKHIRTSVTWWTIRQMRKVWTWVNHVHKEACNLDFWHTFHIFKTNAQKHVNNTCIVCVWLIALTKWSKQTCIMRKWTIIIFSPLCHIICIWKESFAPTHVMWRQAFFFLVHSCLVIDTCVSFPPVNAAHLPCSTNKKKRNKYCDAKKIE